jgi:expansin (peptidoglycan-binding protein)
MKKQIKIKYCSVIAFAMFQIGFAQSQSSTSKSELNKSNSTQSMTCDEVFTGEGTFYDYAGGGNCSFENPNTPVYTGAMNEEQYSNAITCGACIEVTGSLGTVTISIEDRCPECLYGDIDLSPSAFELIDDLTNGRVPISWKIVACPYSDPVKFRFKEGSSQYWTAVQVRNHVYPVAKLEYKVNGSYVEIAREDYNYFVVSSGMGSGPYDFRITDIYDNAIEEENIPLLLDEDISGNNQFSSSCNTLSVDSAIDTTLNIQEIQLSPNPAKTDLTINYSLLKSATVTITIYDMLGKEMKKTEEQQYAGDNQKILNIENLENGIYLLKLIVDKEQQTKKFIINK